MNLLKAARWLLLAHAVAVEQLVDCDPVLGEERLGAVGHSALAQLEQRPGGGKLPQTRRPRADGGRRRGRSRIGRHRRASIEDTIGTRQRLYQLGQNVSAFLRN